MKTDWIVFVCYLRLHESIVSVVYCMISKTVYVFMCVISGYRTN